jgi:hypothetical protein
MKGLLICFFLSTLVTLSIQTDDTDDTKDSDNLETPLFPSFNNTNGLVPANLSKKEILPVIIKL